MTATEREIIDALERDVGRALDRQGLRVWDRVERATRELARQVGAPARGGTSVACTQPNAISELCALLATRSRFGVSPAGSIT